MSRIARKTLFCTDFSQTPFLCTFCIDIIFSGVKMSYRQPFFYLFFLLVPLQIMAQAPSVNAILDLSDYSFEEQGAINLEGGWDFYWNELIEPGEFSDATAQKERVDFPYLWTNDDFPSFGAATFRLQIVLPSQHPELALSIPDVYSAYHLYVNGVLFAENGTPALQQDSYTPYWNHSLKSLSNLPDSIQQNELELVLHIANFDHSKGGISQQILLGTAGVLATQKLKDLAYSWTLTGGLLLAGLFFMGLYIFSSTDRSILYFSLFCLVYTYRVVGFGVYPLHDLIPGASWMITLRLEYLTLFISVYFFGLYTYHLYPKEASRVLVNILSSICLLFTLLTLLSPPHIFTLTILPFFIILIVYILYGFYVYVLGMLHKRPGSSFALASTGVALAIFLYQIANYFGYINRYQIFDYSGQLLFIFLQSQILSFRFTKSLKEARINAEAASKAKSEFLSTMSHEIRTPLNAVIGYSDLLDDGTLNQQKKDFVNSIRISGENLLGVINNILDYSKIESGKLRVAFSEVDPKELIKSALDLLSPIAAEKQIDLVMDIQSNFPKRITTDKTRLQQVLINLINNAIKFTKEGTVTVNAGINNDPSFPGNLYFKVQDTGIGIAEQDLQKLFKRFSQVDTGITRKYGGTGLGLVISKEIVEALGGRIDVQSHQGEGTVFTFTINAGLGNDETSATPASQTPAFHETKPFGNFNHLKVLVVEDNILNQQVILKILDRMGLQADLVENGQQAVKQAYATPYDLIFMDMNLPVLSGEAATREIRGDEESKSQQSIIIALTANATTKDRELCFEAGMNDFLTKPITIEQTYQALKKWAEGKKG